jgi:hypothetical protein
MQPVLIKDPAACRILPDVRKFMNFYEIDHVYNPKSLV